MVYYFISVDCQLSSWRWGKCSKSCGGGYKYATRWIVRHAKNGGKGCSNHRRKSARCGVRGCPACKYNDLLLYYYLNIVLTNVRIG